MLPLPPECKSGALLIELHPHMGCFDNAGNASCGELNRWHSHPVGRVFVDSGDPPFQFVRGRATNNEGEILKTTPSWRCHLPVTCFNQEWNFNNFK